MKKTGKLLDLNYFNIVYIASAAPPKGRFVHNDYIVVINMLS